MRFGPVPLAQAEGQVLAHNISDREGRRVLRKGRPVDEEAVALLAELGYETVFIARLEADDVPEGEAAERIARLVAGPGVDVSSAHAGRVNITAAALGVVRVSAGPLCELNGIDGVTVATLATHSVVRPGHRAATVKVIPYALPREAVAHAESLAGDGGVVSVQAIPPTAVAVVLVGGRGAWDALAKGLGEAIATRMEALSCRICEVTFAPLDEVALARVIEAKAGGEAGMIVVAGETAIMDSDDLIPRGLRRAGGRVEHLGLPMDPGHLLLLGYLGDVAVVGAPGCVRGTVPDGFDAVVPRLLAGERLTRKDLQALGHGGLLSDPRAR